MYSLIWTQAQVIEIISYLLEHRARYSFQSPVASTWETDDIAMHVVIVTSPQHTVCISLGQWHFDMSEWTLTRCKVVAKMYLTFWYVRMDLNKVQISCKNVLVFDLTNWYMARATIHPFTLQRVIGNKRSVLSSHTGASLSQGMLTFCRKAFIWFVAK